MASRFWRPACLLVTSAASTASDTTVHWCVVGRPPAAARAASTGSRFGVVRGGPPRYARGPAASVSLLLAVGLARAAAGARCRLRTSTPASLLPTPGSSLRPPRHPIHAVFRCVGSTKGPPGPCSGSLSPPSPGILPASTKHVVIVRRGVGVLPGGDSGPAPLAASPGHPARGRSRCGPPHDRTGILPRTRVVPFWRASMPAVGPASRRPQRPAAGSPTVWLSPRPDIRGSRLCPHLANVAGSIRQSPPHRPPPPAPDQSSPSPSTVSFPNDCLQTLRLPHMSCILSLAVPRVVPWLSAAKLSEPRRSIYGRAGTPTPVLPPSG